LAFGIGLFLLKASNNKFLPEAKGLMLRAARTVALSGRFAGPTQCHGLAGNIEFLLDVSQSTGKVEYFQAAKLLGRLLEAFAIKDGQGLVWASDPHNQVNVGYMVGYAGVAACLARLSGRKRLPRLLSRKAFKVGHER
jgi:lantibiotic modifying enzyme